ncbi:Guanylate kinase [Dissulfuribacter thermophilus]|uniref:Guanylate kinase n=1 Tax=Dissulfuribacter thermophilus TaxID=1156395 RepID=A0A1B9F504_9BACT|nr:guanylate kinase [Dissulfuribacter thermophilus]OCC15039.1 Guanylate kinase [Dissulfuribacter thermophilus]
MKGEVFVVSAPSGAGKTTILKRVLKELNNVAFSVSHTTRPPRVGEVDGVDYHFVSKGEFQKLIEKGAFLEWAKVHSDLYGTSRSAVENALAQGIDVILDVDVQGARSIRSSYNGGVYVFIAPPSMEELKRRLEGRGTETEESLALRLENARRELEAMDEYDFIIVNDELDLAVSYMKAIIMSNRCCKKRVLHQIKKFL